MHIWLAINAKRETSMMRLILVRLDMIFRLPSVLRMIKYRPSFYMFFLVRDHSDDSNAVRRFCPLSKQQTDTLSVVCSTYTFGDSGADINSD